MNNSHEHAFWTHYSQNRSPMGKISQYIHPGENSTWTSHTLQKCGVLRSTRILTLDQLPAPAPWTASRLRLTPVSRHTINSTKPLVLFYSPTERVTETRHVVFCVESRSTTWRRLSWWTWSFSLHTHTSSPISSLLVTKLCPGWCYLISEGLNKLI